MKSKELKTYNLPAGRVIDSSINAKPYHVFGIILVAGLVVMFIPKASIYGVALWMLASMFLLFLPPRVLIEFSEEYFVLYNKANRNDCILIYYEDVVSWRYDRGVLVDEVVFELTDGSSAVIEAFSKPYFEARINPYMKEKKEKTGTK